VITQVDLMNFMVSAKVSSLSLLPCSCQLSRFFQCHAHTTVDFGPQVNFLVGVNGSGKSAVLTGITMALGGNAKATVR
jgi:predicted ATPase